MVITSLTMVRPWLVALLVLLTERRTFGISRPPYATVAAHAEAAPATSAAAEDINAGTIASDAANITEISTVGCNYKGRSYEPGSSVNTDQPCLKCTCVTGSLVCHLQVCPELPDPPPQGCVIVHKRNKCCAHLQCFYEQFDAVHSKLFSLKTESRSGPARMENSAIVMFDGGLPKGCIVNGTIYAEGSAMDSSSLCEYCYCIKRRQQCVRPQCSLTIPGCTAVYKKHTCCPVRYKCSPLLNTLIKNTTDAPTTEMSLSARLKDCRINGRLISLGEPVIGVARSSCETCFCINGQVRCDKVICPPIRAQISPNCGPVFSEGHCCPTSYNCTTASSNDSVHVSPTTITTTTTEITTLISSSTPSTTTVVDDDFIIPLASSSSSPSTVSTILMQTENAIIGDFKNTIDPTMEDPMESRHANPAGLIHDDFGGLNVTEKSNNFEMDYDEPTLPPSLPNLKIIPFVAADAVFDEPGAAYDNSYQPIVERVYNVSEDEQPASLVVNSFSPPVETEGGFVPKDPPDGAIYVPEKVRTTTEHVQPIVHQDKPVVGRQPIGSAWCLSNGNKYKHGELLTDPSACNICVCFNAKIVCQENCPAVKVGCQRISDPNNSTCCGRIVCNEILENDVTTEHVIVTKPAGVSFETTGTVAAVEHIVYSAPPTEKPKIVTSPSPTTVRLVVSSSSATTPIPLKLIVTTVTPKPTTRVAQTTISSTTSTKSVPVERVEWPTPEATAKPLEDEDYSFESMFSFLFNGDVPGQPPSAPANAMDDVTAETRIEHRTDDDVDGTVETVDVKPQPGPLLAADRNWDQYAAQNNCSDTKPLTTGQTAQRQEDKLDRVHGLPTRDALHRPASSTDAKPRLNITDGNTKPHVDGDKNVQSVVKHHRDEGEKPPSQDFGVHRTEVTSQHYDVVGEHLADSTIRPEVVAQKANLDFGHNQTPVTSTHSDVVYEPTAKPHFDFKPNRAELKPNYVAKPLKTKADTGFNLVASALKISGCNIYGRMYRVGKIIAELSNPCLECMCTEIGVHCNQLKC